MAVLSTQRVSIVCQGPKCRSSEYLQGLSFASTLPNLRAERVPSEPDAFRLSRLHLRISHRFVLTQPSARAGSRELACTYCSPSMSGEASILVLGQADISPAVTRSSLMPVTSLRYRTKGGRPGG